MLHIPSFKVLVKHQPGTWFKVQHAKDDRDDHLFGIEVGLLCVENELAQKLGQRVAWLAGNSVLSVSLRLRRAMQR